MVCATMTIACIATFVFELLNLSGWILVAVFGLLAAVAADLAKRAYTRGLPLALGLRGERKVAEILGELRPAGYQVIHDIEFERGNIDHVLVGPTGIFAIEVKTRTKVDAKGKRNTVQVSEQGISLNGGAWDLDPLHQTLLAANNLRTLLISSGVNINVHPVLVYPGWWVQNRSKSKGVAVYSASYLPTALSQLEVVLSDQQVSHYTSIIRDRQRSMQSNAS